MPNFSKMSPIELSLFLSDFIPVANTNLVALGYVAADITALTALKTDIDNRLAASVAAKAAAKSATVNLKIAQRAAKVNLNVRNKQILANVAVPNTLKVLLGLKIPDTVPSHTTPNDPISLVAYGTESGTNLLDWFRNENIDRTQFVIEAKFGTATAWQIVDVVMATKFQDAGRTPGVKAVYRVYARRGERRSGYSNEASVYS